MALTLKILGIGAIADYQEKTLVSGTLNKGTLVQSVSLTNTAATSVTVTGIYVKVANASRRLVSPQNFTIAPNAQWVFTSDITLGSTPASNSLFGSAILDTLVAQVSGTVPFPSLDYVVCGMERDL